MPNRRGPHTPRQEPPPTPPEWLDNNVKTIRIRRGLTQAELASKTGLGVGTIADIENMVTGFSAHSLWLIARALKVSRSALVATNPLDLES